MTALLMSARNPGDTMSEAEPLRPPPIQLTADIAAAVNAAGTRGVPVAVAYVDDRGRPQLSLRGTVQVFSDDQLALWARSRGLPEAIRANPNVALLYQDLANGTFYQFSGRAQVDTDPTVRDTVFHNSAEREQAYDPKRAGSAVVVAVDSVQGRGPGGSVRMVRPALEEAAARSPLGAAATRQGAVMTQMLIVGDVERSVGFYRDVLGATVVREQAPAMLRFYNGWLVLNTGGGPTPDKPQVTVAPPDDPTRVSAFLNIRVADLDAVYRDWAYRGAQFITEPLDNHGFERRCYLNDPDGYLIELGQTTAPAPSSAEGDVPIDSGRRSPASEDQK
jgi:catechol 2,3-dioxygenase-like lactoylglutathione lyase family enzyme